MAANLRFMLEQENKTILEISVLVSSPGLNIVTNTKLHGGWTMGKLFKQSEKSK